MEINTWPKISLHKNKVNLKSSSPHKMDNLKSLKSLTSHKEEVVD
jgi:hypothetical protein